MHSNEASNLELREAAIEHVRRLSADFTRALPWGLIHQGFIFHGQHIHLACSAKGIFKPRQLSDGALSIRTVVPKKGRDRPYEDHISAGDGAILYKYRGEDADHADNRYLRLCLARSLPIIYFIGLTPGLYLPVVCRLVGDDSSDLSFHLLPLTEFGFKPLNVSPDLLIIGTDTKRYAVSQVRRRLHQQRFRADVLAAYTTKCAVCRLRHPELLQAAHIIPDREEAGRPDVTNGLALCNLHHAAYDSMILGIDPDLRVHLRDDVLEENDGPMLESGLRAFHEQRLMVVPRASNERPRPDLLEVRWARFRGQ